MGRGDHGIRMIISLASKNGSKNRWESNTGDPSISTHNLKFPEIETGVTTGRRYPERAYLRTGG